MLADKRTPRANPLLTLRIGPLPGKNGKTEKRYHWPQPFPSLLPLLPLLSVRVGWWEKKNDQNLPQHCSYARPFVHSVAL